MARPVYIDTHCHLNLTESFDEISRVLERAQTAGVERMVVVGINIPTSIKALELARTFPSVFATVGVHPTDCLKAPETWQQQVLELASEEKVVGIGETGLDYYWKDTPPDLQQRFFRDHLDLALATGLPAIIHNREADSDILRMVLEHGNRRGVFHCWPGDWDLARPLLEKGYHLSFTGTVTFRRNEAVQDVATRMPLDRLMLETDSPFLTPVPHRGERPNEPRYLPHVAMKIAELRQVDVAELAHQTTTNADRFFRLSHA